MKNFWMGLLAFVIIFHDVLLLGGVALYIALV